MEMQSGPNGESFGPSPTRMREAITSSLWFKIFVMGFLVVVLMIPVSMVESIIHERQGLRFEAQNEIAQKWGGEQMVSPPVLRLPWVHVYGKKPDERTDKTAYFLPSQSVIEGKVKSETRYRGVHKVLVYTADLEIRGSFKRPDFEGLEIPVANTKLHLAELGFALLDMKGLKEIKVRVGGKEREFAPGQLSGHFSTGGVRIPFPIEKETLSGADPFVPYSIRIKLNGTHALQFIPLGETNVVRLTSDWTDPSFNGLALPEKRTVAPDGFTAEWSILNLARPYAQSYSEDGPSAEPLRASAFGVSFFTPVDVYQQSQRSAKYAFLFVFLTFLTMFMIEILGRVRIHPMQYVLIGSGLVLFYLLLLSLSEHIGFLPSYLSASGAIIGLISVYSAFVLNKRKYTFTVLALLASLYGFLFVLLQEEDYALLMGSIGLFLILATVMFATRRLNWYEIKADSAAFTRTSESR